MENILSLTIAQIKLEISFFGKIVEIS
uniref:Uncharacterized protein n=1 Tax=Anguilla anguilla TaxID=7936 RepID=A0A0E9PSJ3_ANGAN